LEVERLTVPPILLPTFEDVKVPEAEVSAPDWLFTNPERVAFDPERAAAVVPS
jgi:hypothetical protein